MVRSKKKAKNVYFTKKNYGWCSKSNRLVVALSLGAFCGIDSIRFIIFVTIVGGFFSLLLFPQTAQNYVTGRFFDFPCVGGRKRLWMCPIKSVGTNLLSNFDNVSNGQK